MSAFKPVFDQAAADLQTLLESKRRATAQACERARDRRRRPGGGPSPFGQRLVSPICERLKVRMGMITRRRRELFLRGIQADSGSIQKLNSERAAVQRQMQRLGCLDRGRSAGEVLLPTGPQ